MSDPLLSSLCRICHINPPKYCCPRCSQQTCSLACSKRHKLWSDCNGVRDPTVFKRIKELATPAGIDHDYNFITSIERGIERSDRRIVEEKRLLRGKELFQDPERRHFHHNVRVSESVLRALGNTRVRVDRAPKGMKRQVENGTRWNKTQNCLEWQVEWQREDGKRVLGKVLEKMSLGEAYAELVVEETRANLRGAERKLYNKRKAEEAELRKTEAKRARLDENHQLFSQRAAFQNAASSAWNLLSPSVTKAEGDFKRPDLAIDTFAILPSEYDSWTPSSSVYFYLLRPYTPSSFPRVLTPLHQDWTLKTTLRNRVVLEFPTIYALSSAPNSLPDDFMLEYHFLQAQNKRWEQGEDEHEDDEEDDTDKDDDMEDGEIA